MRAMFSNSRQFSTSFFMCVGIYRDRNTSLPYSYSTPIYRLPYLSSEAEHGDDDDGNDDGQHVHRPQPRLVLREGKSIIGDYGILGKIDILHFPWPQYLLSTVILPYLSCVDESREDAVALALGGAQTRLFGLEKIQCFMPPSTSALQLLHYLLKEGHPRFIFLPFQNHKASSSNASPGKTSLP